MSDTETHTADETRGSIWPMFFIGLLLIVLFFLGVVWLMSSTTREAGVDEARSQQRMEFLEQARQEAAVLQTYSWVDKEAGTVRIPIDRAVEKTLASLTDSEPKPAYPITQSPPSPPADAIGIPEAILKLSPAAQAAAAGADDATAEGDAAAPAEGAAAEATPEGGNE